MNTFNGELFTDAFYQNPYEVYEQIREKGEVVWSDAHDTWLIAAHQQVASGLTDPRLSRRLAPRTCPRHAAQVEGTPPVERLDAVVGSMMMFTDPPEHTRLRSLCNKAFTPRSVRNLRPWIQQVINELLVEIQRKRKFDVIEDLARPLPLIVLCRLLGFPQHDRSRLKRWSDDIIAYAAGYQASDELKQKAVASLVQFEH